jgi:preprotein translocase subunit SecF
MGAIFPFGFPFVFFPFSGILLPVAIVGIIFWSKTRERELQTHEQMRIREMEHQRKMKELELELEKAKAQQAAQKTS